MVPRNNQQKGQALFEMIIFLPMMIVMLVFLIYLSSAVNGSINQQKITRGYFYARLKHQSMYPLYNIQDVNDFAHDWKFFGMSFIGWRLEFNQKYPVQPCYPAKVPYLESPEKTCGKYSGSTTAFIRVSTVYGVCGASYTNMGSSGFQRGIVNNARDVASMEACTIQQ